MSRVLNVSENNYKVKVQSGGTITLDTGVAEGIVRVTGNLIVDGEYTTMNVTNMVVEDNVIVLNNGESGSGITEGTSGVTIDRGTLDNAEFLFDETVSHYDPYKTPTPGDINGTFVLQTANGDRSGLQLSTIVVDEQHNLYFDLQNTISALELVNIDPDTYASEVFGTDSYPADPSIIPTTDQDNYIVNKRYIQLFIQSGVVTPGMADVDKIYKAQPPGSTNLKSRVQATTSSIQFFINESLRSIITSSGLTVDNINVFGNTVTNLSGNNLILTSSNNQVEVDGVINLDDQVGAPGYQSGTSRIYSLSQNDALELTPGRTGIFFKNTIAQNSDELVAKNRALLFSMLF